MKSIFLLLLLLVPVAALGQARTSDRVVDAPFSQLAPTAPNGSERHCINCQVSTPCTSGGTGAFAIKLAGVWHCSALTGGSGDVVSSSVSSDNELVLFSGATGKLIKRSNAFNGIPFLVAGVLSTLNSTGSGNVVRDTAPTILTPTIASFVNAQHGHVDAASGGQLNASVVFASGTVPPVRLITGSVISSRCLHVDGSGAISVAAADCGSGGGSGDMVLATPQAVTGAKTFDDTKLKLAGGAYGVASASLPSVVADSFLLNTDNSRVYFGRHSGASWNELFMVGVSPALTVANGGTGLATLTANNVLLGNGTGTPTFVAPGASGQVLSSNGTTWTSVVLDAAQIGTGVFANARMGVTSPIQTQLDTKIGTIGSVTDAAVTFFSGTSGSAVSAGDILVSGGRSLIIPDDLMVGGSLNSCADGGSTDTYACSLSTSPGAYQTREIFWFKANTANTGAATVNFNSLGAKTIKKAVGGITTDLDTNDIRAGQLVQVMYDGINMQMQSMLGNASSGSGTVTVVSSGNLTSTALVTGGGSQLVQTPCATCTLSGGGDFSTPGGIATGAGLNAGGNIVEGNATGDTAASYFEANSGDAASNAEPAYLKLWSSHATKRKAALFPCTNADGFLCIATGTPVADASNIILTTDNTATLTGKTYDTEATGNVFTSVHKTWFPASGCVNTTPSSFWDLPTSTPAVAACVTGTNTQKGVLQFADTSGGFSAQNGFLLPADFSGTVDARIIWKTTATSGNAKFSLSTICTDVAATATDDPAFNTASTVTTAAPGTANRLQTSSITSVTITGCTAGQLMHLKLFRDGNDGSDTLSASLDVIGVEITTRRAQ